MFNFIALTSSGVLVPRKQSISIPRFQETVKLAKFNVQQKIAFIEKKNQQCDAYELAD